MTQAILLLATDSPLRNDLHALRGATPPRRELLHRLGITTIADLLLHLPRGYEDLTAVSTIENLKPGESQMVQGEVVEIDGRRLADGRTVVSIVINDGSHGSLEGAFFNQPFMT